MPMRTLVYRVRPTKAQHERLQAILADQCRLYNAALEERVNAWARVRRSISFNDQTKSLTQIRAFDPAYGSIAYNVSKWTLKRLDSAFQLFFRRLKQSGKAGFPRFRSVSRWNSFGFHQAQGLRVKSNRLHLVGIEGAIRLKLHRAIPAGAQLKSAVFTHDRTHWRVALNVELPNAPPTISPVLGIDVGVNRLATDSNGREYINVRPRSKRQAELKRAQRSLARKKLKSGRRKVALARVRKIQRAMQNHRTTHLHDIANAIVAVSPWVAVEALNIRNMTRSARASAGGSGGNVRQKAGLNRAMADAAPGRLITMLTYKAESAGGQVIKVDPKYTSQACSACGIIDAAQLSLHRYRCACGLDLNRDHNAAINIMRRGQVKQTCLSDEAARGLGDANVGGCATRCPAKTELVAA